MTAVTAQPAATESSRTNGGSTKNAPVPGSAQRSPSTLRTVACSTIRCRRKIPYGMPPSQASTGWDSSRAGPLARANTRGAARPTITVRSAT
ncbi:hypothetical protein [Streptomyces violascens]|uniref:hypothetical protein n=1 Tax=Streptomyces violascens TaxID=67381 RepID=UPI00368A137D